MERTTRSSESRSSDLEVALESLDQASFECLEMLEGERVISSDLLAESEIPITRIVKALDATPAAFLPPTQAAARVRYRSHLAALRAYLGGGFYLETEES